MIRREIPPMTELLVHPSFRSLTEKYGRTLVRDTLRAIIGRLRKNYIQSDQSELQVERLFEQAGSELESRFAPRLTRVINATGTLLHTNLGRAPLAREAMKAVHRVACGYCNLELDLNTGLRGQRTAVISDLLITLTGAEAGIAVNNNAGAVLLVLSALARDQEVIVSRGELVEIGGGFRIPDVMAMSGATLREVGTTNRTHPSDYRNAITPNTALLFKASQSNFGMIGYTKDVSVTELSELGKQSGTPVVYDLGSGCLVDGTPFGWQSPQVSQCIADGADIVTFSGDKLLGGPQAGIIVGKKLLIQKMARHPLHRALRLDKMTLAALEATLLLYQDPEMVWKKIPVLQTLSMKEEDIQHRAMQLNTGFQSLQIPSLHSSVQRDRSTIGGGALPLVELPTWTTEVHDQRYTADEMSHRLRSDTLPVLCRIRQNHLIFDLRTIEESEIAIILTVFQRQFGRNQPELSDQ